MPTIENNTLRTPERYLDEVAFDKTDVQFRSLVDDDTLEIALRAMYLMLEDAFKAQKEICFENAKITDGEYKIDGHRCNHGTYTIDSDSIRNAPTPTFDNQNKN